MRTKTFKTYILLGVIALNALDAAAQLPDTTIKFGTWQFGAAPLKRDLYPEISGRFSNVGWKDIEIEPDVWNWIIFDSDLTTRLEGGLPVMYKVYVKDFCPDWLFTTGGVPKVIETDSAGLTTGFSPYYLSANYNFYFKRMITKVREHVEQFSPEIRNKIIAVQGCFGNTGDYINYKGSVPSQYDIKSAQFDSLFYNYSTYFYNEYKNTNPKITLISNPGNQGKDQSLWLLQNCPNSWFKTGSIGKGYQLNDEKTKASWLYNILNTPQNGSYVRARCEITSDNLYYGWWTKAIYKNMYALLANGIYWGLDWSNQTSEYITNTRLDEAFNFFNKYAGQKNPAAAPYAMCALRDGLDASDAVRFPEGAYGKVARFNKVRYQKIATAFAANGAKLEDVTAATMFEANNLDAAGTNDVGWDIFPGNYDRYLHQIKANETTVGYWNVNASADTNSIYGKYARGFDIVNGKNALYFDVDSAFLNNAPLNGAYPVSIEVTYLDTGYGSFRLYYDSKTGGADKQSVVTTCTNSGTWKKAAVTLTDAYFGNRGFNGADFYIKSINNLNVIFSTVELGRPKQDQSDVGLSVSETLPFDTLCVYSTSTVKSFSITGAFLNGSNIKLGPFKGYTFSFNTDSTYGDFLTISKYGNAVNKTIYVKFAPSAAQSYTGYLQVSGGGYKDSVLIKGTGVLSSPALSPNITNITCNGNKDGVIELLPTSGSGPFTYNWKSIAYPSFASTADSVSNLKPGDYSVSILSKGGCLLNATYTVTEPEVLNVILTKDSNIICKGGNTTVTVNGKGGTLPYTGTGSQPAHQGSNAFTITDVNGCLNKGTITLDNGLLTIPAKPTSIYSNDAATKGLCDTGNYQFSVNPVSGATLYKWGLPSGARMVSSEKNGLTALFNIFANLSSTSISVKSANVCGSSSDLIKSFSNSPANPGAINGPTVVIKNQTDVFYSVNGLPGLKYFWSVNGKGIIKSGQNTPAIFINWNNTIGTGKITVKSVNSCDSSNLSTLNVTIGSTLAQTGAVDVNNITLPESDETPALLLTPNPAKDLVLITFNTKHKMIYGIEFADITGRVLAKSRGISEEGKNTQTIDVQSFAAGVYFVTFTNGRNRKRTYKLLKE